METTWQIWLTKIDDHNRCEDTSHCTEWDETGNELGWNYAEGIASNFGGGGVGVGITVNYLRKENKFYYYKQPTWQILKHVNCL